MFHTDELNNSCLSDLGQLVFSVSLTGHLCSQSKKPHLIPWRRHSTVIHVIRTSHAEDAMKQHMANLQNEFDKYQKTRKVWAKKKKVPNKKIPFSNDLTTSDIDKIMKRAMKNSNRWRRMKKNSISKCAMWI